MGGHGRLREAPCSSRHQSASVLVSGHQTYLRANGRTPSVLISARQWPSDVPPGQRPHAISAHQCSSVAIRRTSGPTTARLGPAVTVARHRRHTGLVVARDDKVHVRQVRVAAKGLEDGHCECGTTSAGHQWSSGGHRWPSVAIGGRPVAIGGRPVAIGGRQWPLVSGRQWPSVP